MIDLAKEAQWVRSDGLIGRVLFSRRTALVATSLAMESLAAGILLVCARDPRLDLAAIGAASHVAAALLLTAVPMVPWSRRLLSVAAVLAVPLAGIGVAATVIGTKGRGLAARRHRRATPPFDSGSDGVLRLADTLPAVDSLVSGDEEERRAALATLAHRIDPEALASLRWATASPDPDLALSAALALDEIGERAERRFVHPRHAAEVRRATG